MEDSSEVIESSDDNNILSSQYIKLPQDITILIELFDNENVWKIAKLINGIKQLPLDIIEIIRLYARVGAYDKQWMVICELNNFYKDIELWLEDHIPAYRLCPHCAGSVQVLYPVMSLICSCESKYPTQKYKPGIYGLYAKDKKK